MGIVFGCAFVWLAAADTFGIGRATPAVAGYGAIIFAVCMLACVVPTRRALRVEPTEALRVEG